MGLGRLGAEIRPFPAPVLEHRGLEGAELGQAQEADQVAAMDQPGVAVPADQPPVLRPVQAAVEEVVELGAGQRPAGLGEDALAPASSRRRDEPAPI